MTESAPTSSRWERLPRTWGIPAALFLLALILRWYKPTIVEFGRDEALTTRLGLLIAYWGYRPLEGVQASVGPHQFPHFLYLAALPLRIWPSPLALVYFIGFLNALAVPLTYWLGRRYWGRQAGTIAALLFAVNAWSVAYARKIWTQNITLFTVLFFVALFLTFVERRPWALAGAWAGVALLIGLHLEGLAFLFVLLPAMLLWRQEVKWQPLVVGLLLFALLLGPYVVRDAQQEWQNVRRLLAAGQRPPTFTLDAVNFAFLLASGRTLFALAGELAPLYRAALPPLWPISYVLEGLLLVAVVHAGIMTIRRRGVERRAYVLLLLWFWVPVLLQLYHPQPVFPHYFIILYPAPFLLIAALVARLNRWPLRQPGERYRLLHRGILAFLILWAGWQVVSFQRLLWFVEHYPTRGGFGTPLKYYMVAADKARATAKGTEIVIMAPDAHLEWNVYRLVFDVLLFTHPRRFVNGQNTVVIPRDPATYLIGPMTPVNDVMEPAARVFITFPTVEIADTARQPDERGYLIARSRGQPSRLPPAFSPLPPIRLANGVSLVGYQVQARGERTDIWVAWTRAQVHPQPYHLFVHALDAKGQVLAVGDVAGLLPYYQREGDWVFGYVTLPVSVEAIDRLEVGMYTWPDMTRARVLTPCPQCLEDRVVLPLAGD